MIGIPLWAQLADHTKGAQALVTAQTIRLRQLEVTKQKLVDAYLEGTLSAEDIKGRRRSIEQDIHNATRLIEQSNLDTATLKQRLETILELLRGAHRIYEATQGEQKRWLNNAVFSELALDALGDDDPKRTRDSLTIVVKETLTPAVAAVLNITHNAQDAAQSDENGGQEVVHVETRGDASGDLKTPRDAKTPGELSFTGGSNLHNLAVAVGFEPTVDFHPHTLSRRAP